MFVNFYFFLSVPILDSILNILESSSDLRCEETLDEVILYDTFLYYLFAYDDTHIYGESTLYVGRSLFGENGCCFYQDAWIIFPYDSFDTLKVGDLSMVLSWRWSKLEIED